MKSSLTAIALKTIVTLIAASAIFFSIGSHIGSLLRDGLSSALIEEYILSFFI